MTVAISMFVNSMNQIVVCGIADRKRILRVMDHSGELVKDVASLCEHNFSSFIAGHPVNPNCILEACNRCKVIHMYNIDTGKGQMVYSDCKPIAMCHGPDDSMLVWDTDGKVLQLQWNSHEKQFKLIKHYDAGNDSIKRSMCYIKDVGTLIVISHDGAVQTMKLSWGSLTEKNNTERRVNAEAVTCDSNGRIYVCRHNKLSVIDALNGEVLHKIKLTDVHNTRDICWTPYQPKLTLLTYTCKIRCYNVE